VAAVEGAIEVDVDHGSESVRRQLCGRADEVAGGVVDQDVQRTETLHGCIHCPLDFVVVRTSVLQMAALPPSGRDGVGRGLQAVFLATRKHDAGAKSCICGWQSPGRSRAAAGDQGCAPFRVSLVTSSFLHLLDQ